MVSTIVVRVQPRTFGGITDLLSPPAYAHFGRVRILCAIVPPLEQTAIPICNYHCWQPHRTRVALQNRDVNQREVEISLVIGINQTNHFTNQERPCTTLQRIKKELSICPSSLSADLVTFPVLGQIKPQTPRLVVSFRQFLQVSVLRMYSPLNPQA